MEKILAVINTFLFKIYIRLSRQEIRIGSRTTIYPHGFLAIRLNGGAIEVGSECEIHRGALIVSWNQARIKIGDNVSVHPYTVIQGNGPITIGDNTRIAGHCIIVSGDHVFQDKSRLIRKQGMRMQGVTIGNDVWIGGGVKVLDGSVIPDGCVIGAGSLVKGTLEPYGVYVGTPARKISERV